MFRKITKGERPNTRDYGKGDPRFARGGYVLLPHVADKPMVDEYGSPADDGRRAMPKAPKYGETDWDLEFGKQLEKGQEAEEKGGVVDQKTLDPEEFGFDPEGKPEDDDA